MDGIALASVLASAAVALTTLVVQAISQRGQRKHESTLAYEERVWSLKSDALFRLIRASRDVTDYIDGEDDHSRIVTASAITELMRELKDVSPTIETYGSDQVRSDLLTVRRVLRGCRVDYLAVSQLEAVDEDVTQGGLRAASMLEAAAKDLTQVGLDFNTDELRTLLRRQALIRKQLLASLEIPANLGQCLLALIDSARLSIRGG